MEARKRTAATPRAAEKSEPPSVAALRAKKEKAKDEKAADSALLASLALGALALALLSGVFVYRERLGLQPLFDRLAGVPAAGNASEPLVPREDSTAPCVIAVPADYHCDDTGCPLPSTSPCAAKYAKLDTVAELRMIDRVLSMVVVSATKPAGSAPVHKLLIGPQNPDEGGKINRFTVQPPTDNCANVVTNLSIASTDPWLVVIDNFLTDAEVDHAMKNGLPGLQPSGQFHGDENAKKAFDKSYRTSSTSYLGKVADEIITCMERRASDFSAYPVANIEALQFLRYEIGQEYKLHWFVFVKPPKRPPMLTFRGPQGLFPSRIRGLGRRNRRPWTTRRHLFPVPQFPRRRRVWRGD